MARETFYRSSASFNLVKWLLFPSFLLPRCLAISASAAGADSRRCLRLRAPVPNDSSPVQRGAEFPGPSAHRAIFSLGWCPFPAIRSPLLLRTMRSRVDAHSPVVPDLYSPKGLDLGTCPTPSLRRFKQPWSPPVARLLAFDADAFRPLAWKFGPSS